MDKLIKIARGLYRYGKYEIFKVERGCWRIVTKGYGNDFIKLEDAVYFCRNGGSLYPPQSK